MKISDWNEGPVDQSKEHFEVYYGSPALSWDTWLAVALIGRPMGKVLNVQITLASRYPNRTKITFKVLKDIMFFIFELCEPDPWKYAMHHCGTMSNLCGDVHWAYVPAVEGQTEPEEHKATNPIVILEVGAEGGTIVLLGSKDEAGQWCRFWIDTDETAALEALSDEDRKGLEASKASDAKATIAEALTLLDTYRWFRFRPMQVLPEFRDLLLGAVRQRGGKTERMRWIRELKKLSPAPASS